MTPAGSCIFDQNSKCLLKGGCCDHNCNSPQDANGSPCNDEIDTLIEWRKEKAPEGEEKPGLKSG
jgi:hypothetical protein